MLLMRTQKTEFPLFRVCSVPVISVPKIISLAWDAKSKAAISLYGILALADRACYRIQSRKFICVFLISARKQIRFHKAAKTAVNNKSAKRDGYLDAVGQTPAAIVSRALPPFSPPPHALRLPTMRAVPYGSGHPADIRASRHKDWLPFVLFAFRFTRPRMLIFVDDF